MANATMQALQTHAEKLNQQVAEVNASIKALGDVPDDSPALLEYRKQLRRLNSDLKDVNTTMKDYTRGVKAAGELYRHYAMGNIEDMSIKAIRAGVNGMKKRYDNLKAGGDPGDAEEMRLIEAITTEADVVVKRFKTDYQHVVEEIARGGTVTEQTLKRTRDGLADLMQTAETEAEKNELTNYWQKVGAAIEAVAVENRRLRGEVADREEAMRIAYATDHDGSQQAIHDAEARADAARRENDELRQRLDLKQQQRRELEQEMDINSMQVRSLMDQRDELKAQEKEDRAIRNQRVDDANKELNAARRAAKTQQQAYDEQKQTVEKLRTEVQGLTDDIRKMGEVKAPTENPVLEGLKRDAEAASSVIQKLETRLAELKAKGPVITSPAEEWNSFMRGGGGKHPAMDEPLRVLYSDGMDNGIYGSEEAFKRAMMGVGKFSGLYDADLNSQLFEKTKKEMIGSIAEWLDNILHGMQEEVDERFTAVDSKGDYHNIGELLDLDEKQKQAFMKKTWEQQQRFIEKILKEKGLDYKAIIEMDEQGYQRFYADKKGGVEALKKTGNFEVWKNGQGERAATAEENDAMYMLESNTKEAIRQSSEYAQVEHQLTVAKTAKLEIDKKIVEAQQQSTTAQQQSAQSSEQLAQKQEQLSQKTAELNQQQDKLNGMVGETVTANQRLAKAEQEQTDARNAQAEAKKHEGEAIKKVEDELRGLTDEQLKNAQAYSHLTEEINTDTAAMQRNITTEQEATREADRLRSGSIDKMEQALARLRESNRKLDPTIDKEEWERGERAIGQLNLRLEELKKQSAELRREPVLDMMTQRMKSLSTLSSDALQETKKFWEAQRDGAKNFSEEYTKAKEALELLAKEERQRVIDRGESAFDFFQREDYRRTNAADTEEQRKALVAYRDALPADATDHIEAINALLEKQAQFVKEAAGEWMSLEKAMELASKAGTDQFAGSAKDIQLATQALERQRDTIIATIREKRNLGQATKAEEDQLADLTKKLRSLKFEQDNVNMSQEKMRTLIETPANAVNLDELRAAIKRADGQLRQMQQSLGENSSEYKRFAEQVRNAKNVMKEMEGQAKASATAWEKAFSRLKTYVVMYMGFNELWQKVSGTLGDLMQLSDRMGEVGKTTQMTAEQVGRLTDRLRDLDTRTSLVALTELSAKAGQLGLKTEEDILGFTEAANKMLVALPEMGADGATQMMKVALATGEVNRIKKDMDKGLIEGSSATAVAMEKIASTIDQLRANSAAAAPQITDFVKRVGAVGAQSNISIDQVAALGSTVDALGMRVEMSATALSRMIPAIRNNAFEVAKAIGMAPEALRKMFDEAGGGMNAMLAIFQHIKDAGMNPDDIEKMLGMGGMRDIMKDLNQQGARAGIVFAGLSQNVDVLRQHLGIAAEAYEENVAIQQEYDRMSETTAAKWERLKNQFEEMWVGTSANNALGGVIDALRVIVDLISGPLNTAFNSAVVSIVAIKSGLTSIPAAAGSVFDYLKESAQKAALDLEKAANATDAISDAAEGVGEAADVVGDIGDALSDAKEAGEQAGEAVESATGAISGMGAASKVSIFSINGLKTAWKGLDTTMKANIIVAVIALLYTLGKAIYDIVTSVDAEKKALAEANQEADRATEKLGVYFDHLKDTTAELDAAKKATEGLTAGTDKATEAEIRMTKATDNHRTAIANINQNYSKYLGFMLTEYDRAEMVAAAHNKIAAAIRREILMKQKQASIEENEKKHQDDLSDDWAKIVSQMTENDRMTGDQAASARLAFRKMLSKSFTTNANGDLVASDTLKKSLGSLYNDNASLEQLTAVWMARHLQQNYGLSRNAIKDITGIDYYKSNYGTSRGQYIWTTSKEFMGNNLRGDYLEEYFDMQRENAKTGRLYQEDLGATEEDLKESTTTIVGQLKDNINAQISLLRQSNLSAKERNDAYAELARALEGVNENVDELETAEQKQTKQFVTDVLEKNKKFIDSSRLQRARDKIQQGFDAFDTLNTETNNIWGNRLPAESTDWKNMTAEQLVNRRKQMKDFVNAIQTDTDVKAVLEEDKALKKAIEAGMSSDMRTVIEWYNTERLKIQDELHARHLTNTGDWLDPKKERMRKKQLQDEWNMYLREIDAFYTERKTRIEEAGTDDGLTEAEIRNRTLANEMEWRQRRAELQKLYADKSVEVTAEEQQAIFDIISERTGDDVKYVKAQIASTVKFMKDIGKMSEKELKEALSKLGLGWERDFLKQQQAVTQQMKAIQDIIDKERPFNGITKQLRESLATMDILTGDMRERYKKLLKTGTDEEKKRFNEEQNREELRRTSFLLGQAEQAYSTTIDRVMQQMREKGMTAWADWLSIRPEQQEALMAQLRQTYDAIQDAIKKEASQLKKQAEIMWNNILVPGGDGKTTMKQILDRTVAQLGIDQGRVSRANSLIGAGASSERVADKLAIQQMRLQLTMQEHYYNLMKKQGRAHVDMLNQQADAAERRGNAEEATRKRLDAQHAEMALNLATAKEETELAKQREEIIARTEESQNRLYTELRSWADLLTSSLQGVFEASHAGDAEYYNEMAKLNLTGKGGPGAGTYVIIDDAGTSDATAHYEYLDERQALERQHEIEVQNAQAEAWRKLMDDINMKMSEQITDWLNAAAQNASVDANTDATLANTEAIVGLTAAMGGKVDTSLASGLGYEPSGNEPNTTIERIGYEAEQQVTQTATTESAPSVFLDPNNVGLPWEQQAEAAELSAERQVGAIDKVKVALDDQFHKQEKGSKESSQKMTSSTQSAFAKMTAAANLYGIAYQAMSNDNLSAAQKFSMMAIQAAGQSAITALTVDFSKTTADAAMNSASVLGKLWSQLGWGAVPVYAIFTGLLGGLMGLAASKIAKSKSEIAQATGASVGAGRLATGMLTYAEGNVNELTDPASLTPGRQYNVDGADGKTYRARYMGKGAKTHITNGAEFHLVGEAGREAIIDAKTTRLLQMNETGIWRDIQTLYNGGSISGLSTRRRRGGVRAYAEGNIGEFEEMADGGTTAVNGTGGMGMEQMLTALDRNSAIQEALLERLNKPIYAQNILYGPDGLPNVIAKLQKEAQRHGEKYL